MKRPVKAEKPIVNAIMAYLKRIDGCFAWKEHGGMYGTAGLPDIIACYRGRFLAIEVKRSGGKLTKLQDVTLHHIQKAGGTAIVARCVGDVKDMIHRMDMEDEL